MIDMRGQLEQALNRLPQNGRSIDFFLRDDDVDNDEETLRTLLHTCLRRQVPVNLEVIPANLGTAGIRFLRRQLNEHPGSMELHQHGWLHVNHELAGKKCEFGPSRSFEQQYRDICTGKARMDDAFGPAWYPAFTPPWNRCTEDTCRALAGLGFSVLSTDERRRATGGYPFRELPVTMDLFTWKGGAKMRPPEELVNGLISLMEAGGTIGILLHHKVMDGAAFSFLDPLLGEVVRLPRVRFHTFRNLAERKLS